MYIHGSLECDQYENGDIYELKRPLKIEYFGANRMAVSKIRCGS